MSINLAITGFAGHKNEQGHYEASKEILRVGYNFLLEKGLDLLNIREINRILVGDNKGSDLIGRQFAKQFNLVPEMKLALWDNFSNPSEAAKHRSQEIFKEATHAVLFKVGSYWGGNGVIDELVTKSIPVLVFDLESEEYFTCQSSELKDNLKTKKTSKIELDYKRIAQFLLDKKAIICDTETTGVGSEDQVIEIAFVDAATGYCYFHSLLRTEVGSSEGALAVHGISDRKRLKAPTIAEIYPIIERFFDYPIVAYNAGFDFRMIERDLKKHGIDLPVLRFEDLMPLVTAKFGEKIKLSEACDRFGVQAGTHSAKSDSIATSEVLRKLAE